MRNLFHFLKKVATDGQDRSQLAFHYGDEGLILPSLDGTDLSSLESDVRPLAAYLLQLEEEDCLLRRPQHSLVPWDAVYELSKSEDHAASLGLLQLPPLLHLIPVLGSEGGLSDPDFRIIIKDWLTADGRSIARALKREGAVFHVEGRAGLVAEPAWALLKAVKAFGQAQKTNPGELTNQLGWSAVSKAAKFARARLDGFLQKTEVLRPETLRLQLRKSEVEDLNVLQITPDFEGSPQGWIDAFDRISQIPERYSIASANGGITHVLVAPEVRTVLQEVRNLPGRRVAGDRALRFLRNPYASLGEDAGKVIDEEQFEREREAAGLDFFRFALQPRTDRQGRITEVALTMRSTRDHDDAGSELIFSRPSELSPFIDELRRKLDQGLPCGFWKGYELELSDFDQLQLEGMQALLTRWHKEASGGVFDQVLDLCQYGERVLGIGMATGVSSPWLQRESGQQWLPEHLLDALGVDGTLLARWDTNNAELLAAFQDSIADARVTGELTVEVPSLGAIVTLPVAEAIARAWAEKLKSHDGASSGGSISRSVLQIDHNVEELGYVERRSAALALASAARADLPESLMPSVSLREHQSVGIAWLQHLFQCSPNHCSGALLADDMGLGKTLQLLTLIGWYLEQPVNTDPVLVVAPVSLLDNWQHELKRFFAPHFGEVLRLNGQTLSTLRYAKHELPTELKESGIFQLLRQGWRGKARLVLTTYETLRDHEFSLARERWGIVVCDEAQKIKNPGALVTQAAKALPARFKIACTGTPVENSLTDLWCLFDFIQPGLLGSLNEFGRQYGNAGDADASSLTALRELIEPQVLRRLKSDVAKDLPLKMEDEDCKRLTMSSSQRRLYQDELSRYKMKRDIMESVSGEKNAAMLGLLHTLKMVCAHPHAIHPIGDILQVSPKMRWTLDALGRIKAAGEKAIVFTELRDIQRAIQLAILERFQFQPTIVNGDTSTATEKANSRQRLIDEFQVKPGFNVIILSTSAVGFGVNIQAANHVIHFTRPWNPAKEDQATDRAYRIGQLKDVMVYYPTVRAEGFESFEEKLDVLLQRKRQLAQDMLHGAGEIDLVELTASLNV